MQGVTVPEEVGSLPDPWILELGGISWARRARGGRGECHPCVYVSRNLSRLPLTLGIPRSPHPSLPKRANFFPARSASGRLLFPGMPRPCAGRLRQTGLIWDHGLCHPCWRRIPGNNGAPSAPTSTFSRSAIQAFSRSPPFPRKRRFPIKTASNYLGLAADQKGLLPGLFSKPSGKAGC